jgi:hypothetical protein
MKTIILSLFLLTTLLCRPAFCGEIQDAAESNAWANVNALDTSTINAYLTNFPNGQHSEKAKACLVMHMRMDTVRKEKDHSVKEIIPNAHLGFYWLLYKKWYPETATAGLLISTNDLSQFRPVGGLATPSGVVIGNTLLNLGFDGPPSFVARIPEGKKPDDTDTWNLVMLPTGDGSIVSINTAGWTMHYIGCAFKTADSNPLIFGVVTNVGLVYLAGAGEVKLDDGALLTFPPATSPGSPVERP